MAFSNLRPYKIYPNWDFWFENKPSDNPGVCVDVADNNSAICQLSTPFFQRLKPKNVYNAQICYLVKLIVKPFWCLCGGRDSKKPYVSSAAYLRWFT
jgi:hypothetical protein